jgi:hypothetical protein
MAAPAWAQHTNSSDQASESSQTGTTTQSSENTSTTTTTEVGPAEGLSGELVGIKPQVGFINFRDAANNFDDRGAIGLTLDMNAASALTRIMGIGNGSPLFIGPSIGAFYSHIGAVDGGFFGSDTTSPATPNGGSSSGGANLVLLPADLKVGWNFGYFRAAVHAGGNVFYSSVANAVALGINPRTSTSSNWNILPDVGADLEYGMTNKIALIARPDWTMSGSNRMLALTVGASIPLG